MVIKRFTFSLSYHVKRVFLIAKLFDVLVCCVPIAVLVSGKVSRKRQDGTQHRLRKLLFDAELRCWVQNLINFWICATSGSGDKIFDFTYLVCELSEGQTRIFVCCHYRAIKQWPTKVVVISGQIDGDKISMRLKIPRARKANNWKIIVSMSWRKEVRRECLSTVYHNQQKYFLSFEQSTDKRPSKRTNTAGAWLGNANWDSVIRCLAYQPAIVVVQKKQFHHTCV